ncbi:MAG: serine O-acetyltransferase [Alphaproteobacteria bacterium]|nr:serine O-acetyltransferase [Alphaproteobacteria bacterium]
MFKRLQEDIASIVERDPAARSALEVLFCYPGIHALLFFRLSHWLWANEFKLLGRMVSQVSRILTGIEIHPGATIGRRLFIDHGMGVVIGETAVIGDDVTLYHGVTLGGTSLHKGRRHPTLEDGVIVGSGAQILGPHVIGQGARIGANAVVLSDVPKGVTMVGIPARVAMRRLKKDEESTFHAYGLTSEHLPDPVARSAETLHRQVTALSQRLEELEQRLAAGEPEKEDHSASPAHESRAAGHG